MNTSVPTVLPNSLLLINASLEDALSLAKKLLNNVAKVDSGNHPDLHIYCPEGKSLIHPMHHMQRLIQEMSLPPFEAPCKVFILDEAEKMLPASSNALLKTLEEPEPDSYFFLLTDYPDRLLPTILSRLYPLHYSPKVPATTDLAPYFALAYQRKWDELLDNLPSLEEENPEVLFNACLDWASLQPPALFFKMMHWIDEGKKAIQHNIRITHILLNIFLKIRELNFQG